VPAKLRLLTGPRPPGAAGLGVGLDAAAALCDASAERYWPARVAALLRAGFTDRVLRLRALPAPAERGWLGGAAVEWGLDEVRLARLGTPAGRQG
jgi:hypothetical protein